MNNNTERSLINTTDAEWRTRHISIIDVVKSLVSQVTPGQDITKLSLPSILCHPFSMLELISHRELLLFDILFQLDTLENQLERFMVAVKWYISLVRQETMEKKPFNPVLGETHFSWVQHDPQTQDTTEFISEQVSHHPPITAFIVKNPTHNLKIESAVSFGVKLARNSASVTTSGSVVVSTGKERFELTKCLPDLKICNVINPGPKYIVWVGDVRLTCPGSGYYATIQTNEKRHKVNSISGAIYHQDHPDKPIYKFEGVCGKQTLYWSPDSEKDKEILVDHSLLKEAYIQYLPPSLRPEMDSMRLWVPVANAIIENDMATADEEKKKIEEAQRSRITEKGSENIDSGVHFQKTSGTWKFKENLSLVDLVGLGKKNEVTQDIVKENTDDIEKKVENSNLTKEENSNLTKEEGKIFQHPE